MLLFEVKSTLRDVYCKKVKYSLVFSFKWIKFCENKEIALFHKCMENYSELKMLNYKSWSLYVFTSEQKFVETLKQYHITHWLGYRQQQHGLRLVLTFYTISWAEWRRMNSTTHFSQYGEEPHVLSWPQVTIFPIQ